MIKIWMTLLIFTGSVIQARAQYDPQELFVTDFYNHQGNPFRSADGRPSQQYWQNRADYEVEAAFDTKNLQLTGTVSIRYKNNSPDDLDMLWLQLDQNDATEEAKVQQMRLTRSTLHDGYDIKNIKLIKHNRGQDINYQILGTRMRIYPEQPVKSKEEVQLIIEYAYQLHPSSGGDRSGYMDADEGRIYEFSYWYPRMAVYDDYYGWNTLPYIGSGEMYLDYGDIDYKIRVPSSQVVVGSGVLQNEKEILNERTRTRLQQAWQSDETVMIRSAEEWQEPVTSTTSETTTWHFKMKNTRDVAWAMSDAFVWDAARINLSDGKTALAQSVYPIASVQEGRGWARSTEMLKFSTEYFSDYLLDYPYEVATSVAGSVGGMEFPGIVFNHWDVKDDLMFLLASHEIGHTWFPMIVGSDERRDAFMDEGFNVFVDIYAQEAYNNGEFAPKRDGEYAPGKGNPSDEIAQVIKTLKDGPVIVTPPDNMQPRYTHPLAYFKAAHGLVLLREIILGHEQFDFAFKRYVKNWAYKHPRPEDFFRSMDNGSGEDLTWFWNGWFYHNWELDQAVQNVQYVDNNPEKGAVITIANKQQMAFPVLLTVEETGGAVQHLKIPVDVWKYGATAEIQVRTSSTIRKVVLDEKEELPDIDRSNNVWTK